MIVEDKQNILKSFEGKRIDESVHVKRWAINSQGIQDSNQMDFHKYAIGNNDSKRESSSQQNLFATHQSQVHQIDTGFKKLKNNQIQKLKQLKQEYDVLRSLNIEQKPSMPNIHQKAHSEQSSIHQSHPEQILSSSSRQNKSLIRNQNFSREAQILSLEKKQLQMVINNSMRKIQQLLHNQMQYKKQIHQLKLQASGRQNADVEYESMIKTLKKNEINQHQNIEALKKQNEKNKFHLRQLNEKISVIESQLIIKDQQIRLLLTQKRKSEDLVRLEKDRYFNLQIDYKKVKMEYQLLEKDKNNEISRLTKQLGSWDGTKTRDIQLKLKRSEEDLEIKDKRYNVLLNQLEQLKKKNNLKEQQLNQLKMNQAMGQLDKESIEEIIVNFRQKNDSVAFDRQMNQVIKKLQLVEYHDSNDLKQEIQLLKNELHSLKVYQSNPNPNIQQYVEKIEQLQIALMAQTKDKDDLAFRLKKIQRENDDLNRKLSQSQKYCKSQENLSEKLKQQIKACKQQMRSAKVKQQHHDLIKDTSDFMGKKETQIRHTIQKQSLQKQIHKYRLQIQQLDNQVKVARRQADQNDFKVSKALTESEFRLKMQQTEHETRIIRMNQDMQRKIKQYHKLKQQLEEQKQRIEKKLAERQIQLEKLKENFRITSDDTQSTINNLKLQYESTIKSERQRYKLEVQQLSNQVMSLSKINEKYMKQTNKYIGYENQLSCLRQIMRRSIHLSQGVDHLWRIKETEYQNVNELLRQILN